MQESRLFRIIYYLLDKGKSTAPELAEKFEVSVRTIYRDIISFAEHVEVLEPEIVRAQMKEKLAAIQKKYVILN